MAGEIASAYVALLPSFSGGSSAISRELDGPAEAAGKSAGDKAGSGMAAGIANALKGVLVTGGGIMLGLGAAGLKAGAQTAAGMEQARIGFTTMLGSAQKADGFLQNLAAFAAKTPFEFPELQTAASSLVSAGINADKVIPIMTSLGNATAGMGTGSEGIKRATIALQQMNAAGKITAEDLNQLRDAGIPVYDLLAAALHKPKEEVAQLAQQGKLGKDALDQMMAALESGQGLERFAGMMDKQSESLSGLWSTFKDTINMGLAQAVQPLIPVLKDGLGKATEFAAAQMPGLAAGLQSVVARAQEMGPKVDEWRVKLGQASDSAKLFIGSFTGAGADVSGDLPWMNKIIDAGAKAREVFDTVTYDAKKFWFALRDGADGVSGSDGFVGVLESLGVSLHDAFDSLKSADFSGVTAAFGQLSPLITNVSDSSPALVAGMNDIGKVFGFVADHVDLVVKAMPFLLAAFAAWKVAQAANNVVGKESLVGFGIQITQNAALIASHFALAAAIKGSTLAQEENTVAGNTGMVSRLRSVASIVAQTVAAGASAVAQFAVAAASAVWTGAQWLLNAALNANPIGLVVVAVALLVGALIWAWNNSETFRDIVLSVWAAIKGFVLGVVNWLTTAIPAAWAWIQTTTATVWNAISGFFTDRWNFIQAVFQMALTIVRGLLTAAWTFLYSSTVGTWNLIVGVLSTAWENIKGNFWASVETVKGWLSSAWDNIKATASGAWNGIIAVIRGTWNSLVDVISGPVRTVLQWIKDHFVAPLNDILEKVGVSFRIPFPSVPGPPSAMPAGSAGRYASGSWIQGHSPHPRADNIPIWATAKEFMIRQWSALKLDRDFPGLLEYLNRYGTLPGMGPGGRGIAAHAGGGPIRGYADGGVIGAISSVARFFTDPLGAMSDMVRDLLNGIGGGMWGDVAAGALRNVVSGLVEKIKEIFSLGEVGTVEYLGSGRVSIGGKLLDATTAGIFQKASAILGGLRLMQGSWSTSVGASGGTHAGAGAMDVWPNNGVWRRAVDVLRGLGDIAWHRVPSQGPWAEHIHGITPGIPGLSAAAQSQVAAFRAGRNGLASNGPDNNGYWRGGRIRALLADNGTILAPGLNFVQNNTGGPEPLARVDRLRQGPLLYVENMTTADPRAAMHEADMKLRTALAANGVG